MTYNPHHHPVQPPIIPPRPLNESGHAELPLPPEPRRANLAWIIPAAVVVALAVFGAGWMGGSSYSDNNRTDVAAAVAAVAPPDPTGQAVSDPLPTDGGAPATGGPTLVASAIELTPKVIDKQCFGSAGCNVSIKVQMSYGGPDLSPDDTFAVTYQVTGDESGPIIGTFEVTGSQYTEQEESLSTRSSKTKISIKVTGVEKVGI